MKKSIIFTFFFVVLLGFSAISQATLMETTITAVVTPSGSLATSVWTAGDSFVVKVIYDDTGTVMHEWDDGTNKIAEQGGGDDFIDSTWLLADYLPSFTAFDDALYIFDAKTISYMNMLSIDSTWINRSWAFKFNPSPSSDWDEFSYTADGFDLSIEHNLIADEIFADITISEDEEDIALARVQRVTQPVGDPIPEPATMLLLGTGLVGVAGAVRRRNRNRA